MQPTYYGHHRRNLTITMIVSLIVVVAFVAGIFAIFGKSPENVTPAVIGSKIDKSLGGERKLLNASVWDGSSSTIWTNGSGTEDDPYLIESAENLAYLRTNTNSTNTYAGVYFLQTLDIDLNNVEWIGIYPFSGNYDGGNNTIYNLCLSDDYNSWYIIGNSRYYNGLFAYIIDGTIKNVNVEKVSIPTMSMTDANRRLRFGGLVGHIESSTETIVSYIVNCHIEDVVFHSITSSRITIGSESCIGGLLGEGLYVNISQCKVSFPDLYFYTTKIGYLGGAIGYLEDSIVEDLQCTDINIYLHQNTEVSFNAVGGAIGWIRASSVDNAYTTGEIHVASINASFYYAQSIGGVIGCAMARVSTIISTLSNLISYVNILSDGLNLGGIVGYLYGNISNCAFYGKLEGCTSKGGLDIGGIAGMAEGDVCTISQCLFDGEIISIDRDYNVYLGGIVGGSDGNTYINNLAQGSLTFVGEPSVAGLATGNNDTYTNNLANISIINNATSGYYPNISGVNEYLSNSETANNYYNSNKITPNDNSLGAKTDEEIKTYSSYSAWTDFDTYWTIDENINDGYPILTQFIQYAEVTDHEGEGTETTPYIIDSVQSFLTFADFYNDNSVIKKNLYWQISDDVNELDLSSLGSWRPIGYDAEHAFTGHLLGNKTNISNLVVDENYTYAGLFGNVASNASIEWLSVYGDIDYDIATYVGGLAGYVADGASISNCYYMGNITGYLNTSTTRNIGGLIGKGAENNVTSSYAIATHTAYGTTTTTTENIQSIYGINTGSTVGDMKTQSTYTQFGFTFGDTAWKIDIQNDGYPYFNLTSCNISAFNITRDITGSGAIMVYVDGQSIPFTDNTSTNSYSAGVTITVDATASTNNAIRSLIINGTTYTSATNKNTITVNNISTTNQAGDFTIVVVFDAQYSITISNGTHSDQGSTTVSGSNITTTNPYKALKSTSITTTSTATTNTSTLKSYITGVTIDGTLVNISSADNTTTTHTINGITYTITRTKTTGFSTQIVTKITITHTLTKSITISTHYNAQQSVSTSVTLVGGDGNTTSTPTGTITADWGSTTNTLTKTEQTDKTFIGWVVNGQIESQEDTFSTQVTSSTTTITELWAVMYNISLTLPSGIESIQVTHMLTGLSYNITGATTLMAGDWIVKVPTGKTLKLNGTTVVPDSQGRYIVSITGNGTISLI